MNYDKRVPCDNCPFRIEGGIRLDRDRIREIATADGEFPCHKTTTCDEDGERHSTPESKQCAGFLIFREKIGQPSQMMRIAERLRMYDAKALMSNEKAVAGVFGSLRQLLAANKPTRSRR